MCQITPRGSSRRLTSFRLPRVARRLTAFTFACQIPSSSLFHSSWQKQQNQHQHHLKQEPFKTKISLQRCDWAIFSLPKVNRTILFIRIRDLGHIHAYTLGSRSRLYTKDDLHLVQLLVTLFAHRLVLVAWIRWYGALQHIPFQIYFLTRRFF